MPFPESPRVVFRENPLAEVICQLRFPTILAIATSPPTDFQDALRESYPVYEREDGLQPPPELQSLVGGLSLPGTAPPPEAVHHRFQTEDGNRVITLTTSFLAVADKDYERWETFRAEVDRARTAVEAIYRPAYFDRVGLRYQDVIQRSRLGLQEVEWGDLLNPPLSGLLSADEPIRPKVRHARTDAIIDLNGEGSVRVQHGLVQSNDEQVYLIDSDFFSETHTTGDDALRRLDIFNGQAGNLFRWAIQQRLRDALGPTELE